MSPSREYWFPAKRYGWGLGLPVRWQGWLTLLAYFVSLGVVVFRFLELTRFRGHLSFGTGGVHHGKAPQPLPSRISGVDCRTGQGRAHTCITASVRPWVGRIPALSSGSQSI
ncbi:hypothetical protein F6X40_19420 [Paraburkholderia sp. UCT31]|nr:hypothetical protein [Paraburkholderia sp. UCT31]